MSLSINPTTKVGALLEAHPELEEVLIGIAPAFAKLRNPVLRKTVAKLATLEQAARIGGVTTRDLVTRLREATGQENADLTILEEAPVNEPLPCWHNEDRVAITIDADAILATGVHPLAKVQEAVAGLSRGGILRVVSAFRPEPLLKMMQERGLGVWSREVAPGRHISDFCKL